jgi:hypothetical protein
MPHERPLQPTSQSRLARFRPGPWTPTFTPVVSSARDISSSGRAVGTPGSVAPGSNPVPGSSVPVPVVSIAWAPHAKHDTHTYTHIQPVDGERPSALEASAGASAHLPWRQPPRGGSSCPPPGSRVVSGSLPRWRRQRPLQRGHRGHHRPCPCAQTRGKSGKGTVSTSIDSQRQREAQWSRGVSHVDALHVGSEEHRLKCPCLQPHFPR